MHGIYNRSMGLTDLLPLLDLDVTWISLQKDMTVDDCATLIGDGRLTHFGELIRDFNDTAALLDLMDLVVTIDTSVAHLAGAMGKPVWILLPFNGNWRWLLDRGDTPWYPSARLFRQRAIANWSELIARVRSELDVRLKFSSSSLT